MKHPPLIQVMFAVMILGILNMQLKGGPLGDLSLFQLGALAIALVGTTAVVTPLMATKKDDAARRDKRRRTDDDFDLSA